MLCVGRVTGWRGKERNINDRITTGVEPAPARRAFRKELCRRERAKERGRTQTHGREWSSGRGSGAGGQGGKAAREGGPGRCPCPGADGEPEEAQHRDGAAKLQPHLPTGGSGGSGGDCVQQEVTSLSLQNDHSRPRAAPQPPWHLPAASPPRGPASLQSPCGRPLSGAS